MDKHRELSVISDEELAEAVVQGSSRAFDELVTRYYRKLTLFIRKGTVTEEDAEDIVQDTFSKAYQNMHRYKPDWKFSTWLYTIGIRTRVDYFRKLKKDTESLVDDVPYNDNNDNSVDFGNLIALARNLKPKQYEVLWLKYVEGLSVSEISKILSKNPVSVRVLLHRARNGLYSLVNAPVEGLGKQVREGA